MLFGLLLTYTIAQAAARSATRHTLSSNDPVEKDTEINELSVVAILGAFLAIIGMSMGMLYLSDYMVNSTLNSLSISMNL